MGKISCKTRMAVAVSLLFVAFATVLTWFTLSFFEEKFTESLATRQDALAATVASSIDSKLALARMAVVGAAAPLSPVIRDRVASRRYLDSRTTLRSLFSEGIFLLDNRGRLIAESPQIAQLSSASEATLRDACRKTIASGKPSISNYYRSIRNPAIPAVFVAAPIVAKSGRTEGVLAGSISLPGSFFAEISRGTGGDGGNIYLFDRDRTMLVHSDATRILKEVAPPGADPLFDRALKGFEGSGTSVATGQAVLTSYRRLTADDCIIAASLPLSEALKPLHQARLLFIAATVAGTTLILFIAWLMMKRLTSPLLAITRHVTALSVKPGAERLFPVGGEDEIGTLAKAFNGMIAELDRKQAALQESENNFRALAETASDGMLVISQRGVFVYTNYNAARMLGYQVEELLSCSIPDLAHPDDLPQILERFNRVINWKKVSKQYETRLRRKDGSFVPVEVSSSLTIWREESADLVIFRDISERRHYEKELHDAYILLHKTFASLNEAVFIVDSGTRTVLNCNPAVGRIFGYARDELIGNTTRMLHVSEEMADQFAREMERSYAEQGFFETTYKMKRKDGGEFHSEHFATPIHDEEGLICSHVCVVRDITERKRSEEKLRRNENHLALAQKVAHVGSWEVDIATGTITWSDEMYNVTGRDPALGAPSYEQLMQLIHPDDRVDLAQCMKAASTEGIPYRLVSRRIAEDGTIRYLSAVGKPILDETGAIARLVGTVMDVTERKDAEEEIRTLNRDLQQRAAELAVANRELEAFGYSLSHDLKAPLTSIYCAAQALRDLHAEHLDQTGRMFVDAVCSASEEMDALIDAMFTFSRISRLELHLQEIDLTALAEQILLRLRMEDGAREVECVVAPGLKVMGDIPLLKSALENLLGNAWKYTRHASSPRIEFGSSAGDGNETFFIRDNGAGFDMNEVQKLFVPFARLGGAENFEGTGIGLSTVQRIIHRHGGEVWGEGIVGGGASFYFTLPPPVSGVADS